jgi:hypothetical protein
MALFEVDEAGAQFADTAAAATATVPAGSAFASPGRKVEAHYSTSAPSLTNLNSIDRAAFEAAFRKANRSGPTNLPLATMRAAGPVGPGAEASIDTAPPAAPTSFFATTGAVSPAGAFFSGVGEPSGDNAGRLRFQSGNWYAARSIDGGKTWTYVNPFTIFGGGFCCDQVVVYDPGRNVWFWLLQYGDHLALANSTNLVNWCFYNWTPASFGFSGELDYNDIALTTNYIYIVSNIFPATGGQGSNVARLPIDPQLSCSGFGYNYFNRTDSFTWKPVSGATDVLYWGTDWLGTLGSSFRIFKWPENTGTISWFDRTLGTTFAFFTRNSGQNCGSANGVVKNWCQFADSRVLGGARYSAPDGTAQVVFSFNAKQGGPFGLPFPYTERVHFRESDMSYLGSDRIWSSGIAWQFTSMATDARGHIGMTTIYGGGTGTSSYFPSSAVFLNDDVTPNQAWVSAVTAVGAGNVCTDSGLYRYGDYLTTRAYRPTNLAFLGYSFVPTANNGACNTPNPIANYETLFGRVRDQSGAVNRWN